MQHPVLRKDVDWCMRPKGWEFLSKDTQNLVYGASEIVLEKIECGQFTSLGSQKPKIDKRLAELVFKSMVKEAVQKQRHYNFAMDYLMYTPAIKNCMSFALSNTLDNDGIDNMNVKKIMKITPGFPST